MSVQRHQVADDLKPNVAVRARISPQRADRLREFILGHLPRGVTVDVVISSSVQTAAVLPVDIDAIVSSDATEIERAQAEQLLAGVDADYLVLVTGNGADLTRIPLNDQLTADHAHQFGLAFHELLHILKTAITAISELLEAEIDSTYHTQVHDLINLIEDGAIESEAIHGENFSDNAGIRLELTRRIHSQTPDDIPDGEHVRYSFWDAVTSCLYDEAIYPTGTTEVLLDEDDPRIQFKSEADRDAFRAIHSELCTLSDDVLAIRSADRSDITHNHDKTASIRRSRRVIRTWTDHIQPVLEADEEQEQDAQANQQAGDGNEGGYQDQFGGGESNEAADQSETSPNCDSSDDTSNKNEDPQNAERDAGTGEDSQGVSQSKSPTQLPEDFNPNDISLSREATSDPHQNVFEQPQVTAAPDPTDVGEEAPSSGEGAQERDGGGGHEDGEEASEERADAGQEGGDDTGGEEEFKDKAEGGNNRQSESDSDPPSRAQAIAQAADRARQREQEHQGANPSQETNSPETEAPSKSPSPEENTGDVPKSVASSSIDTPQQDQLTFGEFSADSQDDRENTNPNTSEDEIGDGPSAGETDDEQPSGGLDEAGQSNQTETPTPEKATSSAAGDTDTGARSESESGSEPESESESDPEPESEIPEGPAHAESSTRSPDEDEALYEDALAGDERASHGESERESIDEQALEEELSALADHLERSARQHAQKGDGQNNGEGGQHGGPGSLDDLDILPISDDLVPPREWGAIEDGADRVADTLEMYLRLDRRKRVRRGLSAGAYDSRAGHRLALGDPRVCKSRTLGNEKQYALVLVLDRSGSMRQGSPPKIEVATQALARFALAAENLGIRVAITDFYRGDARLVKPFSIDTRHVQANLLDTTYGGGTPLADAIGLARKLVEAQRDEPLIITVTDDNPSSADAVIDQIRRSHAPVCSLTIATDCQSGSLSDSASKLSQYYERQETVYTPARLDDRLDQFASLLAGL